MSISPVSSGNSQLYTQATATTPTAAANQVNGKHKHQGEQAQNDQTQPAPPSVNTSGQTTGRLINTTA
ncbi:MAG: hypothetical protein JO171_13775 [Paludibacterium sp.]|uniref:hypothetical protein n=1 Tax=Paludibacterium sp. TaxID=1917523 RepID=UPI0025D6BA15|nr:hypothetical protein [Paludibacterium sp.]MBV8048224.1 hypothetical protein [Paludibacterium sp.]MBV8646628.1 hypothetical protein [Paludibacterium sp.]